MKQFDYSIKTACIKNNSLEKMHVYDGDIVIYEDDTKTDNIRIYQFNTRLFVGLITPDQFEEVTA